jgi:predicted hydrocarbon binding protein/KaiC/GvpD/RAD55 family RecA-like ATPase
LVGPPGSGKSTFCHQAVIANIEIRPVIYVTTETAPSKVMDSLRQKGLGAISPHAVGFVDAFHETVGLSGEVRSDSVNASCEDLTGLGIAISRLQEKIRQNFLLIFDSLTSPYLMRGSQILRFMRLVLLKLAAEGNAVLACVDEGCGKEEDLVAMMSMADGIVRIELGDGSKVFDVMKHPKVGPTKIEVPMTWSTEIPYQIDMKTVTKYMSTFMGLVAGSPARTDVGDYVNVFWPNFVRWCCMLWDPKRFPTITYDLNKHTESGISELVRLLPWRTKLLLKFMPRNFSEVKDMKKFALFLQRIVEGDRSFIIEYLENVSKTGEHYFRGHEHASCWGFDGVGATLGLGVLGVYAGVIKGFEKGNRDWNIVETKCIGLGDPYCEVKAVPGEIDELKGSLEAVDSKIVERINDRLMDRLMGFILDRKPLSERPRLGDKISLNAFGHIVIPAITSERYQMAMRLGGAVGGKRVGECLMNAGLSEDDAVKRILILLEHCRVGRVTVGDTIRIGENCESFIKRAEKPSCHFTTGFLNGFFSAVKNQYVKETKCIAVQDPYCEWEFR